MKIYEKIISILEEKGTLTIPLICKEVNRMLSESEKPILPSYVRRIVSSKKDLFHEKNGNITIHPDKNPLQLIVMVDNENGITYKVNIDFSKNNFSFFEWRIQGDPGFNISCHPRVHGDVDLFKREIYTLKLWDWESFYGRKDGIIIGKTNWTVKLTTKGKEYDSEGTDCYPESWYRFCKAIEKLTGISIRQTM